MLAFSLIIGFTTSLSLFFHFKGETHAQAVMHLGNDKFLSSGVGLIVFFVGVSIFSLSASSISSEYALGTIKNCFVNQPSRVKFLVSKFLTLTIYGTILFFACCLVTVLSTMVFGLVGGIEYEKIFSLHSFGNAVSISITSCLAVLSYLLLGLIAGTLLNSPAIAISLPLIWLIVIEPLLSGGAKIISPYLFGNAVAKMATPNSLGSFSENLLIVAIYLIPLILLAGRETINRDI
jgi:ABC-type transport system involved in multi-copper enzyme maturation permease subunit